MPMRPPTDAPERDHDRKLRDRAPEPPSPLGFVLYVACVLAVLGVCITWMEAAAGLLS